MKKIYLNALKIKEQEHWFPESCCHLTMALVIDHVHFTIVDPFTIPGSPMFLQPYALKHC